MLEKLGEFSINLWEPLGGFVNYLYDSSNVWGPIILFFVVSLLSIYILHRLLSMLLNVKINFTNLFPVLLKTVIMLIIVAIVFSLGFYLYSQYQSHEEKIMKKEQDFGYLLK